MEKIPHQNLVLAVTPAPLSVDLRPGVYSQTSCSGTGSSGRCLLQGVAPRNQRLSESAAGRRSRRWWGEGRSRAGTEGSETAGRGG